MEEGGLTDSSGSDVGFCKYIDKHGCLASVRKTAPLSDRTNFMNTLPLSHMLLTYSIAESIPAGIFLTLHELYDHNPDENRWSL